MANVSALVVPSSHDSSELQGAEALEQFAAEQAAKAAQLAQYAAVTKANAQHRLSAAQRQAAALRAPATPGARGAATPIAASAEPATPAM